MSQTEQTGVTGRRTPSGGYPRTFSGLIVAMVVVVLVVLGWTAFRAFISDNQPTPVRTVEWQPVIEAAASDGQIAVLAPDALPEGWRATSASWSAAAGHLHIGMLTGEGTYVGLEESRDRLDEVVARYVDEDATQGDDVTIGGTEWQTWTDEGGDYAVGRTVQPEKGAPVSYVVVGSGDEGEVRDFAASLQPAQASGD